MRRLIVTADDFGLALPVNEAVEQAHLHGILSTASLMVAAPQTGDAVARARHLPKLCVGLHVVLVNGRSALPPERVPDLVDTHGHFPTDLFGAGIKYFFKPGIRAQLAAEIREQFRLFAKTGLQLDHVNAQNHMHVHPTIFSLIVTIGSEFGLRAVRIPCEPFGPAWRATGTRFGARLAQAALLAPWLGLMKKRARAAGLATNDYIFGMIDTGRMDARRVGEFIGALPHGTSEIYSHPATGECEFSALTDPGVIAALRQSNVQAVTFGELAHDRG